MSNEPNIGQILVQACLLINKYTNDLNDAYSERAEFVAGLAARHPSVKTPAIDVDTDGWWLVYINSHLPGQQMSWHISPRDIHLFEHVEEVGADHPHAQWDGHTNDEKYWRLRALEGLA